MKHVRNVAVIGAGASGLAAAKCLNDEGLLPTVFEQSMHVGGVWRYQDISEPFASDLGSLDVRRGSSAVPQLHSSAYASLTTNSSKIMSTFSDYWYPFKPSGDFLRHDEIAHYLASYAQEFCLTRFIRFGCLVENIARDTADRWRVTFCKHGHQQQQLLFDAVWICSGMFWKPNIPAVFTTSTFEGSIVHAHFYRKPHSFLRKRIVIVGIGNSALDIALELAEQDPSNDCSVWLSCRNGSIMVSARHPTSQLPADQVINSRAAMNLQPFERADLWRQLSEELTSEFVQAGMPEPSAVPGNAHVSVVKQPKRFVELLRAGRIRIRPQIDSLQRRSVIFQDKSELDHCDVVLLCTGYEMSFPFLLQDASLTPGLRPEGGRHVLELYKGVVVPHHPTLAFIGQLDQIGSQYAVSEMQCRWLARILAGKAQLPPLAVMQQDVEKRSQRARTLRFPLFVSYAHYMEQLAGEIGCTPISDGGSGDAPDERVRGIVDTGPLIPVVYRLRGYGRWSGAPHILSAAL